MDRTGGDAEQVGRSGLIGATMAIAMLSTSVWASHMLVTGQVLLPFFSFLSYLMLFSIGFLVTFLLGGLTGVLLASTRSTSTCTASGSPTSAVTSEPVTAGRHGA